MQTRKFAQVLTHCVGHVLVIDLITVFPVLKLYFKPVLIQSSSLCWLFTQILFLRKSYVKVFSTQRFSFA